MSANDRKIWSRIIELYHKEYPYLWDKTNSLYNNKKMRNDAYKVLTKIYRDNFDPEATIGVLRKKLGNLRTSYMRELKKVKESFLSGGETYAPSLWYFDRLSFIGNLYDPDTIDQYHNSITSVDPLKTQDSIFESNSDDNEEIPTPLKINNPTKWISLKNNITIFKTQDTVNNTSRPSEMVTEDWEIMGKSIGLQMRDLRPKQLTIASKLISDTLFLAKLNRLTEESHIDMGSVETSSASLCAMCGAQTNDTSRSDNYLNNTSLELH